MISSQTRWCLLALSVVSVHVGSVAQTEDAKRILTAVRSSESIAIDGKLAEIVWQRDGESGFTQRDPNEGEPPTQKTEIWIAYDDGALYVAARMFDHAPDSIVARIGRRDADPTSDWITFGVDSYHDKRTGFYFGVNPAGSIKDGTLMNDEWSDDSWDGVWEVATSIDDRGWTAEFRIPYSQLRFTKQDEYVWGMNFERKIARRQEVDFLVMVPKKESGGVSRYADLVGIKEISPQQRFEIIPYLSSSGKFLVHDPGDPFHGGGIYSQSLGADINVGLGSNLTLNATVNPDFGQVEVDPAVVNLTQFETFFQEKRPFFVESSDYFSFGNGGANNNWGFNWGNPNYFYSRRVGRPPRGSVQHNGYEDIPDRTHIIGAGKLTGKIAEGWSLGVLQSFTAREYGKVEDASGSRYADVVEPFASYTVVRSLRELNEGRQGIGIIGTASLRDLNQNYLLDNFNRRTYSFGIDGWTNIDEDRTWVTTGWVSTTHVEGTTERLIQLQQAPLHYYQRPDAPQVSFDSSATSLNGYAGRIAVNKQKGNLQFNSAVGMITPGFDSNDMGFLFRTDILNAHVVVGYQWFEPDGTFRKKGFNIATFRTYDFAGRRSGEGYFLFWNAQFMNYWRINGNISFNAATYDHRNTRGGALMKTTNGYFGSVYASTDSRDPMVVEAGIEGGRTESGGYGGSISWGIEWKPSPGVSVSFSPEIGRDITIAQWVTNVTDTTATSTYGTRHVFGRIDRRDISAGIRLDWTFTPKLSLQLYMQPLFSVGSYSDFKELAQPGTYTFKLYDEGASTITDTNGVFTVDPDGPGPAQPFSFDNPEFNFKSLRANVVLRWEYLPGSTIFLVWSQDRTNSDDAGIMRVRRDLSTLLSSTPNNVFLLKIAYLWNP